MRMSEMGKVADTGMAAKLLFFSLFLGLGDDGSYKVPIPNLVTY